MVFDSTTGGVFVFTRFRPAKMLLEVESDACGTERCETAYQGRCASKAVIGHLIGRDVDDIQ